MSNKEIDARLTIIGAMAKSWTLEILEWEDENVFHTRLLSCFVELVQKAPQYSWLLHTGTYRDKDSPVNPQFLELIRAFWLKKSKEPRNKREYIDWIKDILLIPKNYVITDESVESEANKEAQFAVQIIKNIESALDEGWLGAIDRAKSRSPAFTVIHNEDITVNKLLHLCYWYLQEYHAAKKRIKDIQDMENPEYKKQLRILSDRNKSMFEVARVFAIIDTQLRVKQAHGKWTQAWDKLFLVREMLSLLDWNPVLSTDEILENDNPFFQITDTETLYWERNDPSCEYTFTREDSWREIRLEACTVTWKVGPIWPKKHVKIRHIDFRWEKSVESSVLKKLRKDLESTHEILDDRGLRFVVDTAEEANRLCSILSYELWTWPQSWTSKPKLSSNENSWSNFECLKGTLSVWHKRGQTKDLKWAIKSALPDDDRVEYLIPDQWYQLGIEVQIFIGVNSYISAHHDIKSPAHHKNYKREQVLETWLIFYPPGIFPKTHQSLTKILAEKKKGQFLEEVLHVTSESSK